MTDAKALSFDTLTRVAIEAELMGRGYTMSNLAAEYAGSICIFAELVAAEVRAKDGAAPQQAAPEGELQPDFTRLRKALADRKFRGETDLQDLVNMAANIITEDGDVFSGQRGIIEKLKAAPQQEVQEPVRTSGRSCYLCRHPSGAHPMKPDPRGGMRRGNCPTTPAQSAPSGDVEDAAKLSRIASAIRDYHYSLDMRKHGGLAESTAFNAVCETMGMHWQQGAEAEARKEGPTNV